jgi:small nuclear ribonucleoprotein
MADEISTLMSNSKNKSVLLRLRNNKTIMADEISTLMSNSKNKSVLLRLRNNKTIKGNLLDFDVHMNLTLDDAEDVTEEAPEKLGKILLRGDNILAVSLPDETS